LEITTVKGRVFDNPISGAVVTLINALCEVIATDTSVDGGYYTLDFTKLRWAETLEFKAVKDKIFL
tara:strand:- start:8009 stop:8206 length:198 start_codon:yes stop_codon:yes gene_type:complete